MTAATDSTAVTATAKPSPSSVLLDGILSGRESQLPAVRMASSPAAELHPLEGIGDVGDAIPIITNLLAEEAAGLKRRYYPRCALRQQHIVAYMVVNPFATTTDVCAFFGISPSTVCNVARSDTFKALIASHKISLESNLAADIQDQLRATLAVATEVVQKAVVTSQDPEFALATLDKVANRLGLGAKHNTQVQINNNIVTPEMIATARQRRLPSAS